ncbi:unannotated protein [freshwater metagenome]|uniref:Unannotated protein n=1 Tax=freshwater metagenome TaxID=449393 RepID=A0A6J7NYF4_9ZZZZ
MSAAGKDAPEPEMLTPACAGVVATKPNAIAIAATFAIFEIFMYFPS